MPTTKEKKKKGDKSSKDSGLSRRTMLKTSAAAGVVTMLTSRKSLLAQTIPPQPTDCTPQPTNSPSTTPFVQALPIPPAAVPTILNPFPMLAADTALGEAARANHQDWTQFFPLVQYSVSVQPTMHQFHPQIPSTYCWGYNGIYPGPTFINVYGVPIVVRFINNLPVNNIGFGDNNHTTHMHNGHTASESDGFAGDYWSPGLFKDHHYPNVYAGFNALPPLGDPLEAQHTYWYHDHRHSFTATNNYRGINGMYLMYDDVDTGSEAAGQGSQALRLPGGYGVYDIPLNFTDKLFCSDGQMYATAPDTVPAGDKFCVNGAIQPYFNVSTRKYRFRFLNSGPARIWAFNLYDNNGNPVPMTVVTTDGNLLPSPVEVISTSSVPTLQALTVHVSQRYDVIIDFTNATAGTSWFLTNTAPQFVSNATEPEPAPGVNMGNVVMAFNITGPPPSQDLSQVPSVLTTLPNITTPLANLFGTRVWNFNDFVAGAEGDPTNPTAKVFNVNGITFDPNRADASIQQGSAETWLIRNRFPGTGWTHPVHIHLEEGRILDRRNITVNPTTGVITINSQGVPPLEQGRRDVYPILPNDEVLIFMQFRDWFGKYMMHCHNLGHEDNLMLVRWDVTTGPSTTVTSPVYSDGTPNTGNGQVNAGAEPNITPAMTSLPPTFNLNPPGTSKLNRPGVNGSRKGVKA
ncbi:MAG: multicopper oxidase domain-containing protein [Candidatus Sulfotelmatobacter sp.]